MEYICVIIIAALLIYFLMNYSRKLSIRHATKTNLKAVFVGCAKDIEKELHHSLKDIVRLASEFEDYVILIYENDSSDKTVDVIRRFSKKNPNIKLISETHIPGTRTQRLARGRNILLNIAKTAYATYDFLVVMDMDYTRSNTESILKVAESMPQDYSGVTAVSRNKYYDWWAFRSSDLHLNYDCHKDKQLGNCHMWGDRFGYELNKKLRKVESAFNGIGVYRISHIPPEAKYVGETLDGNEVCEHVSFNSYLKNLYVDPNLVTSTWDD